jgi:hypothetical protein
MKTFIKILLVITAIFFLSYYDYSVHGEEYERMKRSKPYWKIGYVYIESIHNESFNATNRTDTIIGVDFNNAIDNSRKIEIGDLISLKGRHIGGDTVSVDFIHFHDRRKWKVILSIMPVIILGVVFIKLFKYDKKIKRIVKR